MIFFQPVFFVFFSAFFSLYRLLGHRLALQNALILAGSYVFYGWWDPRFLILIAASTAIDFVSGRVIAGEQPRLGLLIAPLLLIGAVLAAIAVLASADLLSIAGMALAGAAMLGVLLVAAQGLDASRRARMFLAVSIAGNLGMLATFKYFDFFATEFATLMGAVGWAPNALTLDLVLPVGISFYTFQTMSYTIDIYRREMVPIRDMIRFAAFVSFFPQLVAGPIERARHLLPQFAEPRRITLDALRSGALLFLWGFYKKTVIADNLALIADPVFANPAGQSPGVLLAGVLAFTFQIYCDFSGYSDMARGLARMLGFELMANFRLPYFARTPSEFWRRWHISLSTWLRDYLYIPLGGNRGSQAATWRNLMLTMLLGGLWHGAAWTFVAWGALHGALLAVYRILAVDARLAALPRGARAAASVPMVALLFVATMVGWVFFRAESFGDAFFILGTMWVPDADGSYATLAFFIAPLVMVEAAMRLTGRAVPWERLPAFAVLNLVLFLLCAALFLGVEEARSFIYFDF